MGTLRKDQFLAIEFPVDTPVQLDDQNVTITVPSHTPYTTNQSSITFVGTAWIMKDGRKIGTSSDMAQCFSIDEVITFS